MTDQFFEFIGGHEGAWKVDQIKSICGPGLSEVSRLEILPSLSGLKPEGKWKLTGFVSNARYMEKHEKEQLTAIQPPLGRGEATRGALIPIKKSESWWNMAQDERRKIFEHSSHHTSTGLKYLPAVARKLFHSRDLGQPFDFLTYFEFSPKNEASFDHLLAELRQTAEWEFVEREVEIRLSRD